MMRLISNQVPSNRTAGGKNSSIVGGLKVSPAANWNSVSVASVNSSVSSFGAQKSAANVVPHDFSKAPLGETNWPSTDGLGKTLRWNHGENIGHRDGPFPHDAKFSLGCI